MAVSGASNQMMKTGNQLLDDQTILVLTLAPLLLPVTSAVTGLAMGVTFFLVTGLTGLAVYCLRGLIPSLLSIYVIALLAATIVTVVHLLTMIGWYELSRLLGVYVPLIAMNCFLFVNNEEVVLRNDAATAARHTLKAGIAVAVILVVVGLLRELVGHGTLLMHSELLFGQVSVHHGVRIFPASLTWSPLLSAPGVFLVLAGVLAVMNMRSRQPGQ